MTEASLAGNPAPFIDDDPLRRARERRRFRSAFVLSVGAHALVLLLLLGLWRSTPEEPPFTAVPVTLVHDDEGRAGAIGGGAGDTPAAAPGAGNSASSESSAATAQARPPSQPETNAEAEPKLETPPPQLETAAPTPAPTRLAEAPTPTPTSNATLSERPPPPPAPPERKPTPPRPKPSQREIAQAQPKPEPQPSPTPPNANAQMTTAARPNTAAAPSGTNAPQQQGTGGPGRGQSGTGLSATGTRGNGRGDDDYPGIVMRWISRFQHYPDEAIKKKEEGTAVVGFRFTRDGTILDAWLEKSSGYPLLDQEAVQMVRNASPIPKVPPDDACETCTMGTMPVRFKIGFFDRVFR